MIVFVQKFYYRNFKIFNLSNIKDINFFILFIVSLIAIIGCALLYSTAAGSIYPWAIKQFVYFGIGLTICLILVAVNNTFLSKSSYMVYLGAIFLLIIVKFVGHNVMGAQRWIDLKIFHLQPSEVAKVAVILILAKYFEKISFSVNISFWGIIPPLLIILVPFILVALQPDLATALIILCLSVMMIFVSGASIKTFIATALIILISLPTLWVKMHDYQKDRILNFINPDSDPFGRGYNIIQSKIAIGSGGIIGKGFIKGWQSQLNFLPENQTDFIFSVLAEEFGFLGCLVVLLLYGIIISYGILVSLQAENMFSKMISFGASCYFFLHVAINSGMASGILPAAGVPMPMMSYGGSNLIISMVCIGFIFNSAIYGKKQ